MNGAGWFLVGWATCYVVDWVLELINPLKKGDDQ